jgi:spore coat polysaccharide biosynthesis protein SpsF (cytidylyltransferase family)
LGKISECLKNIIERVEKSEDFKEIILTTNDKKESIEAFQ